MLNFLLKWVTGQGQGHRSKFLYESEALVTRNLHAKYKGSISNDSKAMTNVKVVQQTNKQTGQKQYVPAIAIGDIKIRMTPATNFSWCFKG